jgi:uncharacterized phage-associated protein
MNTKENTLIKSAKLAEKINNPNIDYNIFQISNTIISIYQKMGKKLTHLRLQKLLYFSRGLYYVENKRLLFESDFMAYKHGPVNLSVYDHLSKYGSDNISFIEGFKMLHTKNPDYNYLKNYINSTNKADTWALVYLSQQHLDWISAYHSGSNQTIDTDITLEYFKGTYPKTKKIDYTFIPKIV